jgi:sodium transport system permease protein
MTLRNTLTVYRKELREALRDRRTLISMFLVPAFIMPAILFLFGTVTHHVTTKARAEIPVVAIIGGEHDPALMAALQLNPKFNVQAAPDDWRIRIADKSLRAVVELPPGFAAAVEAFESAQIRIYHYEGEIKSGFAVAELRRFFNSRREQALVERLVAHGLPPGFAHPFEIRAENVAPPEKVGGNTLGGFIPYVIIMLCFAGVIYPAIDLMAGEKERGTLETLLCSPAARIDLVLGKFLLVLTVALTTVACSLASMALTAFAGGLALVGSGRVGAGGLSAGLSKGGEVLPTLDPLGLVGVVVLVLPLAVLFAALALAISLWARTQKEAQTYLAPLGLVVILPAIAAVLPGVELNGLLALVPVLNIALACKELVSGVWPWGQLALIFGSTCVYAAAALAGCVSMFNRESVLFRS